MLCVCATLAGEDIRIIEKLYSLQKRNGLCVAVVRRVCERRVSPLVFHVLRRSGGEQGRDDIRVALKCGYIQCGHAVVIRLVHSRPRRQERCDDLGMTLLRCHKEWRAAAVPRCVPRRPPPAKSAATVLVRPASAA